MPLDLMCYGDVHMKESGSFIPYSKTDKNGLTLHLNNILKGFDFICHMIDTCKPKVLVDLGDFFNDKSSVSTITLYAASIGMSKIREACKKNGVKEWYMLLGNHSYHNEKTRVDNSSILGGYCSIVWEETNIKIGRKHVKLFPYSSDRDSVLNMLDRAKTECDLLVTHLDFCGCVYDSGKQSLSDIPSVIGVPCISGHIHNTQVVGDVFYPGSLVQDTFSRSDIACAGGVGVCNVSEGISFYPNVFSKHHVKSDVLSLDSHDPNRVIIKVSGREDEFTPEVIKKLVSFDHILNMDDVKKVNEEVKDKALDASTNTSKDPMDMLVEFVVGNNPLALPVLREIIGN